MTLDEIPIVQIQHIGDYKFIQVQGPEKRNYIYGTRKWLSHDGLYEDFLRIATEKDVDSTLFSLKGGGRIKFSKGKRTIRAYDESDVHDKFDKRIVKSLLEDYVAENFTDFSVVVE